MIRLIGIPLFLIIIGSSILAFEYFYPDLPLTLPEVVGDANPILKIERRFNDSVSIVKRNETISTLSGKWLNYYKDGEWVDIDTTLVQTPDGFCADKMPFKFCAPLRSTGEAIFTANNQYNIFKRLVITDAPLEERMTAVGVNDVAGQFIVGDLMLPAGKYNNVQYVLYPGAYNDADLIYYVDYGSAPRLTQLVRWNIAPTCMLPLTKTFLSKYSAPVEISNFETGTRWNKTGQLTLSGEPLKIGVSENRGIGKRPFYIWDSRESLKLPTQKIQRIDVNVITAPGQNAYAFTKILPCAFFTNAVYPVYTDTTSVFNPEADAGTVTTDGMVLENTPDAQTWANKRAATGDTAINNNARWEVEFSDQEAAGSGFKTLYRAFLSFNTGPTIPATDDISSSTLKLRANASQANGLGNNLGATLVGTTAALDGAVVVGDYEKTDNTRNADASIFFSEVANGEDEFFELNATGIAAIDKGSGITQFAMKSDWDLADTPVPTVSNDSLEQADQVSFQSADGTPAPELTVIHAEAAGGEDDQDVMQMMYWKLYDLKVALYYSLVNTAYAKIRGD